MNITRFGTFHEVKLTLRPQEDFYCYSFKLCIRWTLWCTLTEMCFADGETSSAWLESSTKCSKSSMRTTVKRWAQRKCMDAWRSSAGFQRRSLSPSASLSWKVRYRTFSWFFSQMSKLYRARSLLYRDQILQLNIRWKALDEIYKIYMLLHRSDLNT